MSFFQKLGKVLATNMALTIVFVASVIFFLYFAEGDIIAGILTALSALVAYITATLLYGKFKTENPVKKVSKKKK